MQLNLRAQVARLKRWNALQLIKVMKLTVFLIVFVCLHVSASVSAQISLSEKDAPLAAVIAAVQQQSGYSFIYKHKLVEDIKVSADLHDVTLEQALDKILEGQPLTYEVIDKTVVIKAKEPSLIDKLTDKIKATLAQVTVTGKVTDELGKPMAGVNVFIKDSQSGTSTDAYGNFRINLANENTVLVFSYIGYETQELRAKDISSSNAVIAMKATATNLHEVVVNKGYYSEKQELSTSNVTTITAEQIERQPVTNVLSVLEGQVPGAFIAQNTGAPGGSISVQIRGISSITNGTAPLYIVDGVPYPSDPAQIINQTFVPPRTSSFSLATSPTSGISLNYLNPDDIESIEVLKDADATSIYGSKAANGAIIITTKKGKAGRMKVDLNLSSGFNSPARLPQVLNTQQYLQMRNTAFANDGMQPDISSAPDLLLWDTTRYTNWEKLLYPKTNFSNAQLTVSGGNTNTQYVIGAGYNRDAAPFYNYGDPGADQKASVHFSINTSSDDKKFNISLSASYVSDLNTVTPNDLTAAIQSLPPDAPPLFNSNGTLNWAPVSPGQIGTWSNPIAALNNTYNGQTYNLVSSSIVSYAILPSLKISANLGFTNTQTNEIFTEPTTIFDPGEGITSGNSEFNNSNTHTWIIEPQAEFKHQLWKGTFSALAGASFQENEYGYQTFVANGFSSDALLSNIASASSLSPSSTSAVYKYSGIYTRLNYDLDEKYIINLTARRDGSSRFGPGKQFGDFGSAGIAWLFSKEKLLSDHLSWLSFGKLRLNYGTSGNDQLPDYEFLSLYSISSYPYQGQQGLKPTALTNPDLEWEIDRKLDAGLDFGFLKNRINFSVDYFLNRSSNQLLEMPLSYVTGFSGIYANLPATVQNTGIEATLTTTNMKSRSFSWTTSANLTIPRNELLSYPGLGASPYANTLVIGQPLTVIKAFKSLGVNPQSGVYQFASANGTPTYNPVYGTDNTTLINTQPRYYGGLDNNFTYKSFSLDFLFQFVKQIGANIYKYGVVPGQEGNFFTYELNAWQKPGDNKPFEQFTQNTSSQAYEEAEEYGVRSTLAYSDASYIRLKNLSLSYKLPKNWVNSIGLQNARIYIQGENLLTITNYLGLDPENQSFALPPLRVWTFGIQVTF